MHFNSFSLLLLWYNGIWVLCGGTSRVTINQRCTRCLETMSAKCVVFALMWGRFFFLRKLIACSQTRSVSSQTDPGSLGLLPPFIYSLITKPPTTVYDPLRPLWLLVLTDVTFCWGYHTSNRIHFSHRDESRPGHNTAHRSHPQLNFIEKQPNLHTKCCT